MFIPIAMPLAFAIFLMFGALAFIPFVANSAHGGGLLAGLLFGLYLRLRYKRKVQALQRYFR